MNNLFKKLLLILLYPFVYIFHPQIRRANALRIKYWAMDRDFFKEERKKLTLIGLFSFTFWFGFLYGLPAMTFAVSSILHQSVINMDKANAAAISQETPDLDKFVNETVIIQTKANPLAENIKEEIKEEESKSEKELTFDEKIKLMKERAKENNS